MTQETVTGPDAAARATDPLLGARILVTGINYAPETTGIAPYTTGVAEHLVSLGAEVTVVTGMTHYPQWRRSEQYAGALFREERLGRVHLLRAGHYVPKRSDAVRRGLFEVSWLPAGTRQARRIAADAVIGVSPSLAGLTLARRAARRCGVRWMAVVQDLMGNAAANGGLQGGGKVAGLVGEVEGRLLRSADLVGVIYQGFGTAVESMGVAPERVRVLPNWTHVQPSPADRTEARRGLGWTGDRFMIVHTGNMGAKQGLDNVLAAAAEADRRGAPVQFVLVGDGNQRAALAAQAVGIERVTFVDPVDELTYPLVLAAADALLVNERPEMVEMSLPSKLTSYLVAGRPVLGAVPAGGWTASVLDASGAALRVPPADPSALVDAALSLATDPATSARLSAAGPVFATDHYSQPAALARYADAVRELLA